MAKFMVGRQPIFDVRRRVVGYELLFRGAGDDVAGDAMTADVLVRTCLDMGLTHLVGDKLAFLNTTRSYIVGDNDIPFPPRQTVLDIVEEVPGDEEVIAGCRRLAQNGYTLAADGRSREGYDPLLELVSMIKVDVSDLSEPELRTAVLYCSAYGAKLVAKRVETYDQLEMCQRLGFDLFQGYLLSRPEIVEGRALPPSRLTCLRILDRLCDPDVKTREIEDIVKGDPSLSYRFLRMAGAGAARGLSRRINSVREGVVLVGQRRLKAWVSLMLLAEDARDGMDEQLAMAMTRAKMAEELAVKRVPSLAEQAFTAGLVSALDLLLGSPLSEIMGQLSLGLEIEEAVLSETGPLGSIVADVKAWEVGAGDDVACGLSHEVVNEAYIVALRWAAEQCEVMEEARR
ncbi:MAG TPA: HDOD domain-containing protein [Acidimicrobiales bacterium]|nr:HDOD domain-containing protein [Acidimicrobiales bacterium]